MDETQPTGRTDAAEQPAEPDLDAFSALYESHADRVYRYLRSRTPSPADAEELTSRTFLNAFANLGRYRARGSFQSWLMAIAHNLLANWHRDRGRRPRAAPLDDALEIASDAPGPEAELEMRELTGRIREATAALAPDRRRLIALKYVDGLTNAEIGRRMGRSGGRDQGAAPPHAPPARAAAGAGRAVAPPAGRGGGRGVASVRSRRDGRASPPRRRTARRVDISWLGHACVRIRTRQAAVVMDPADRSAGFDMGRPTADIVTASRDHPHHAHASGVRGQPIVIDGPGEYEISGVQIFGIANPLPPADGDADPPDPASRRNTAFLLEAEELHVAHLGSARRPPSAEAELLSSVDILILAIGGDDPDGPAAAARTVRDIEPKIVIPIGHEGPGTRAGPGPLAAFLEAAGLTVEDPQPRLSIQARRLGDQQRVVLLEPSRQ